MDANSVRSVQLFRSGGDITIPADSGGGYVPRPAAHGQRGGQIATPETLFDYFINNVDPCDEALRNDPYFESKMRMHPDIQAAWQKRMYSVAAMPWRVEPSPDAPDKETAATVAKYCESKLKQIPNFEQAIEHCEYAVLVGGQGLEVVWHTEADGVERPAMLAPVHMSRFVADRLGNLALKTRDNPVWGVYVSMEPQQYSRIFPAGKFIYHVHRQGQASWLETGMQGYTYYGIGEDVSLYYPVTFDIFVLKYRMKFLERYAMPPYQLYYPQNQTNPSALRFILDSLRGESISTIPRLTGGQEAFDSLYHIERLDPPSGTYDWFQAFSNEYTKPRIDRILLGDSDSGTSQDEKGGYSKDVSKKDAGPNVWFKRDAKNIGNTFTHQFMPPIAMGRYPNLPSEYWPIFSMESKEEKDRAQELEIIQSASQLVPIGISHVYDAADLPQPKKDVSGQMEPTVGGLGQQQGQGMPPGAMGQRPGVSGQPPMKTAIPGLSLRQPVGGGLRNIPKSRTAIAEIMGAKR